jgi:hypothetical protein
MVFICLSEIPFLNVRMLEVQEASEKEAKEA